jgi:hypothetical protein
MIEFLRNLFVFGCLHRDRAFPQREADGLDYETCLNCGARRVSIIQFGKPV